MAQLGASVAGQGGEAKMGLEERRGQGAIARTGGSAKAVLGAEDRRSGQRSRRFKISPIRACDRRVGPGDRCAQVKAEGARRRRVGGRKRVLLCDG